MLRYAKLRFTKSFLILLLALGLVASACTSKTPAPTTPAADPKPATEPAKTEPAKPAGPKIITMSMWSSPENFSPLHTNSNYGWMPISLMLESLVYITDKNDYAPRLATEWKANETYTVYTFKLNPKAKWTDGKPVTAEDVKWTIDLISNKKIASNRGGIVNVFAGTDAQGKSPDGKVSGVKVVDANTIEMTLKNPTDQITFLENVGTWIYPLPKHVLENVPLEEMLKHKYFQEPNVTNGPFKLVKYATDQYIEFDKNPDYHLGAPKIDKLFVKIVKPAALIAALEKGEIDMAGTPGIGEVPITDWDKVKAMSHIDAVSVPAKGVQYLNFNFQFKPFQDKRVRQALVHAINRPLIVQRLLKGEAEIWDSSYTTAYKYLDPSVKPLPYDPKKARQLLEEAKWDFNQEITLFVPTGNAVREQSGPIIAQNLQDAGFKVKTEKMDFATMQAKRRAGEFQLALVGWTSTYDPDITQMIGTGAAYNAGKFSSKAVDDILAKGRSVADFASRKKIYDEFQRLIQDDVPQVFLYAPKGLVAFNKRLVNVKPTPNLTFHDVHLWDVK